MSGGAKIMQVPVAANGRQNTDVKKISEDAAREVKTSVPYMRGGKLHTP
jgi:hypothetical protein